MRKLALLALTPMVVLASPQANAAVSITVGASSSATSIPAYIAGPYSFYQDFETENPGQQPGNARTYVPISGVESVGGSVQRFRNNSSFKPAGASDYYIGLSANPGSSSGNFYEVSFASKPLSVLSFLIAGVNSTTRIVLSFQNSNSVTLQGNQIYNNLASFTGGTGRVTYDLGGTDSLTAVRFISGNGSLGLDTIAGATPEPATWLMMIFGFGLVGSALRRRRLQGKLAVA